MGRPPIRASVLLGATGALCIAVGAGVTGLAWYENARWSGSPEAVQAQRNAEAPRPIWITPVSPTPDPNVRAPEPGSPRGAAAVAGTRPPVARSESRATAPPVPTGATGQAASGRLDRGPDAAGDGPPPRAPTPVVTARAAPPAPLLALPTAIPTATPAPPTLALVNADFRFLDPPEPGARARLPVTVHNLTDAPSGPPQLALPQDWLSGYRVKAAEPMTAPAAPPTGEVVGKELRLTFDQLEPEADQDLEVDLVAVAEVLDPPTLRVLDGFGREAGRTTPPTQAPPARPGPVWSIDIPRLHLHSGVVPVAWEPPLFVVGQLQDSAFVTQGNSVLVGHLRGGLGNVFESLDRLAIGDEVVANSRGEDYHFVVSQTAELPADDTSMTNPTQTPRLTLMTCSGVWNPLLQDYSDRLWVVAEPPELAARTIAARAAAAQAPIPTSTPVRVAPAGSLGNTDADMGAVYGPPTGETPGGLADFHHGDAEYQALFKDVAETSERRAVLVARLPAAGASFSLDEAIRLARGLFPADAQPRAERPEGNQQFVVERFTSPALAAVLPTASFEAWGGHAGDFVAVYRRRSDGRMSSLAVGIGDSPDQVLQALAGPVSATATPRAGLPPPEPRMTPTPRPGG